jgi:hypothetical protein
MSFVLFLFFGYHVNLAWNNETTNESMKKKDFKSSLDREISIVRALIIETDEWEPKSDAKEHQLMPKISIDSKDLPREKI